MNIGFFKLGRSILFNKNKWSTIGGDNEAPILLSKIAELNPKDNFYLLGASDLNKNLSIVPKNIKSLYKSKIKFNELKEKIEEVKLDCIFFYLGPHNTKANISDYVYTNDLSRYAKVLQMFENYSGPIIHALNNLSYKLQIIGLCPDNRFVNKAQDWNFNNRPTLFLAQNNFKRKDSYFIDAPNLTKEVKEVKYIYSKLETVFLIGKQKPKRVIDNRNDFNLILNQGLGTHGLDRFPIIKEYIIDNKIKCNIFGKWNEDIVNEYEKYFKGQIWIENLEDKLLKTKFTFIVPILKEMATAKFWEMIYYGIVPFLHPYYDSQGNILSKDHYLRVNSPKELKEKIKELNTNEKLYRNIFNELQNMLTEDLFNGKMLNEKIFKYLKREK